MIILSANSSWMTDNYTMTERIFAQKLKRRIQAQEKIELTPDHILTNEMLAAIVIPKMEELNNPPIHPTVNEGNFICYMDHGGIGATPNYVNLHQQIRFFCKTHNLPFVEPGQGIGHILMAETGNVSPGDIIVGTDSHTTTHGAFNTFSQGIGGSDLLEILITGKTWFRIPESILINIQGNLQGFTSGKDVALAILRDFGLSFAVDLVLEFF